jgi:hypothetical protein
MTGRLGAGVIAGAAGTTVLNAITYADMALRGRPSSPVPAQDVERLAQRDGVSLGQDEDSASARKEGLGALMGLLAGTAGGVAVAVARPLTRGLPTPVAAALIGGAVMAATDAGSVRLGTTDPRSWSVADWAADVVPHLGYGAGVHLALRALER